MWWTYKPPICLSRYVLSGNWLWFMLISRVVILWKASKALFSASPPHLPTLLLCWPFPVPSYTFCLPWRDFCSVSLSNPAWSGEGPQPENQFEPVSSFTRVWIEGGTMYFPPPKKKSVACATGLGVDWGDKKQPLCRIRSPACQVLWLGQGISPCLAEHECL